MGKLFGTDGIRGVVGENLTVELAFHTGQAIAASFEGGEGESAPHHHRQGHAHLLRYAGSRADLRASAPSAAT